MDEVRLKLISLEEVEEGEMAGNNQQQEVVCVCVESRSKGEKVWVGAGKSDALYEL